MLKISSIVRRIFVFTLGIDVLTAREANVHDRAETLAGVFPSRDGFPEVEGLAPRHDARRVTA